MNCPLCHNRTTVNGSRMLTPTSRRRNHKCMACGHRFVTVEAPEGMGPDAETKSLRLAVKMVRDALSTLDDAVSR